MSVQSGETLSEEGLEMLGLDLEVTELTPDLIIEDDGSPNDSDEDVFEAAKRAAWEELADNDVRAYFREIGRVPLLDAGEEVDLAKSIEAGLFAARILMRPKDPALPENLTSEQEAPREELEMLKALGEQAKEHLYLANLRLVVSIAKRYVNHPGVGNMKLLDLAQEGNIGLMRAVEKFDYTKGFKFSTYAAWWVRQAVNRAIFEQGREIRLPVAVLEDKYRLDRHEDDWLNKHGAAPTTEQLAKMMKMTVVEVMKLQKLIDDPDSYDKHVGENGGLPWGHFIEDTDVLETGTQATMNVEYKKLHDAIDALDEQQRAVILKVWGLKGERYSIQQVADEMGISAHRVKAVETSALSTLHVAFHQELPSSAKIKEYLNYEAMTPPPPVKPGPSREELAEQELVKRRSAMLREAILSNDAGRLNVMLTGLPEKTVELLMARFGDPERPAIPYDILATTFRRNGTNMRKKIDRALIMMDLDDQSEAA